jgi:hypothetical protein
MVKKNKCRSENRGRFIKEAAVPSSTDDALNVSE